MYESFEYSQLFLFSCNVTIVSNDEPNVSDLNNGFRLYFEKTIIEIDWNVKQRRIKEAFGFKYKTTWKL